MDGWMDEWMDGLLDGWMDGRDRMGWDGWFGSNGLLLSEQGKGVSFTSSKQASTNGWLDGNKGMDGLALQQLTTH